MMLAIVIALVAGFMMELRLPFLASGVLCLAGVALGSYFSGWYGGWGWGCHWGPHANVVVNNNFINRYNFKNLSGPSTTDWRETCGNNQDICYAADYAQKHGKKLGVPEWSMDRGQYGWGDLPAFVQMMFGFFRDNADILAFENVFNNGGSGDWHLYPESSINRQSAAVYKQLWR